MIFVEIRTLSECHIYDSIMKIMQSRRNSHANIKKVTFRWFGIVEQIDREKSVKGVRSR